MGINIQSLECNGSSSIVTLSSHPSSIPRFIILSASSRQDSLSSPAQNVHA
jgi:hypothetical protein